MRLFYFFLLVPLFGDAQIILKGRVVEAGTLLPIPYATIGLSKQNSGCNADQEGLFVISTKLANDTIIISSVGYQTAKIPALYLETNSIITLSVKVKTLKEVIITDMRTNSTINPNNCEANNYLASSGAQYQVAQLLKAPKNYSLLQNITLCLEKNQGKTVFRVRVYDFDSTTTGPGEELTDRTIQITSNGKDNAINLEPYRIFLPQKKFFISIEWLIIPINKNSFKAKFEDSKRTFVDYKPYIGLGLISASNMEIWGLSYSNQWKPMFPAGDKTGLLVSATVKY